MECGMEHGMEYYGILCLKHFLCDHTNFLSHQLWGIPCYPLRIIVHCSASGKHCLITVVVGIDNRQCYAPTPVQMTIALSLLTQTLMIQVRTMIFVYYLVAMSSEYEMQLPIC